MYCKATSKFVEPGKTNLYPCVIEPQGVATFMSEPWTVVR